VISLCAINLKLQNKKKDSMFTNGVLCVSQDSPKVTTNGAVRDMTSDFLLAFHSNYVPISCIVSEMQRHTC